MSLSIHLIICVTSFVTVCQVLNVNLDIIIFLNGAIIESRPY